MANSIRWLNTITLLSLCAMIFTLPFSKSAVEIFFIVALISWILRRISSYKPSIPLAGLFKLVSTPLNLPLYLFVLLGFLSILTSISIPLSLKGFFSKLLEGVLIYFIAAETINDRKKLNLVLIVTALSILFICTDGIFQYITGMDFIRHYPICGNRIQASFSNPNGLAGWLVVMFPLVLSLGIIRYKGFPEKIIRYMIWGLICAAALCLTLTYSRGAWIGLAIALFFIGIFKKSKFLIITVLITAALPFIVPVPIKERILAALPFTVPYSIKERLGSIVLFNQPVRNNLWHEAVAIIKDFPILGCGLNTYSVVVPHYKLGVSESGIYPHNSYLQMAAEMGIIGLAAFLWIIFRLFKTSFESIKRTKDRFYNNILIGLLAGMLAFLIHSFFDVNFYALQLVTLMWFIMGLIIAVQRIALKEESNSGVCNV